MKLYLSVVNKYSYSYSLYIAVLAWCQSTLYTASKAYKKQLRAEHRLYCLDFIDEIKDLSVKDPKEFWELLNKHDPKNDCQ